MPAMKVVATAAAAMAVAGCRVIENFYNQIKFYGLLQNARVQIQFSPHMKGEISKINAEFVL